MMNEALYGTIAPVILQALGVNQPGISVHSARNEGSVHRTNRSNLSPNSVSNSKIIVLQFQITFVKVVQLSHGIGWLEKKIDVLFERCPVASAQNEETWPTNTQ